MSWGNGNEESTLEIAARLGREDRLKLTTPNIKEMKMSDELEKFRDSLKKVIKTDEGFDYLVDEFWRCRFSLMKLLNKEFKNKTRPTQEPLQVIEGLDWALEYNITGKGYIDTYNAKDVQDQKAGRIRYLAAKAYQQALEKQEKV